MQLGRSKTQFQQLDAEPRPVGNPSSIFPGCPPPSYRSSTNADDSATFSSTESSGVAAPTYSIKRRNSWINLIESNENLCKKDLLHYTEPPYTTTTTTGNVNIPMPACCTWTGNIYGNNYQFPQKYNLNGRYAKYFTPFYVLNSTGDPIAISKLELTRRIAIIDSTLRDNGKNLICFVMNMNISTMPDKYSLEIGAQNAFKRTEQIHGWEEAWNFLPVSYFGNSSILFDPPIPECNAARWILLNYTKSNQREIQFAKLFDPGKKCSDCYDFCLPELGIERDYLRAETFLNIIRRDCFYLFVPEWRSFAAAYSSKQNEYDFQQFYNQGRNRINSDDENENSRSNGGSNYGNGGNYGNRFNGIQNVVDGIVQPITDQYRNFESKWISLQKIPRADEAEQISNPGMDQISNIASNIQNSPSNAVQSISGNRNYQQQQTVKNSFTGSMLPSSYSNFNLNSSTNSFNNGQTRNVFENGNSDFLNDNDRTKPLLPMPPPSYPIQLNQYSPSSLDHKNSFTEVLQNFGSGNVRQQNSAFGTNNNIGQFSSATKFNGQPNGYNSQLSSSQTFNGLSNTVSIDGKNNQRKNIYDQSIEDGESISKQSNYHTPQPGIDAYIQQAGNIKQNEQDNGSGNQQSVNDQGWIIVG
ncbi:unnamed protein product [Acanthocheilonema viteae]|uniref:Uncharacterized protein n=1 Tax=Acanthocheilonema viteae TaxID=6277 RepID=A0A498S1B5_ACAVI|nr:unnamed protein product [Acanthocheilonema viteae]